MLFWDFPLYNIHKLGTPGLGNLQFLPSLMFFRQGATKHPPFPHIDLHRPGGHGMAHGDPPAG